MCLGRSIRRNLRARQVAEEVARQVVAEINTRGERDFLDGTNDSQYEEPAHSANEALRAQLRRDAATWGSFLAADYYRVLASHGEKDLRRNLIGLGATIQEWIQSLDRRIEHRMSWPTQMKD